MVSAQIEKIRTKADNYVLNALRHQWFRHLILLPKSSNNLSCAQRLTASMVSALNIRPTKTTKSASAQRLTASMVSAPAKAASFAFLAIRAQRLTASMVSAHD